MDGEHPAASLRTRMQNDAAVDTGQDGRRWPHDNHLLLLTIVHQLTTSFSWSFQTSLRQRRVHTAQYLQRHSMTLPMTLRKSALDDVACGWHQRMTSLGMMYGWRYCTIRKRTENLLTLKSILVTEPLTLWFLVAISAPLFTVGVYEVWRSAGM